MNFGYLKASSALSVAALLSACGTINQGVKDDIAENLKTSSGALKAPVRVAQTSRVVEVSGKSMPVTSVANVRTNEWLKKIQISLQIDNPVPLSAVVEKLAGQGLNIVSDLPLNSYTYSGRVNSTDAASALKLILGGVGLDFQADDARQIVAIKPMSSRSWFLNIGNRRASYSSDGSSSGSTSGASQQGGSAGGTSPSMGQSGLGGAGQAQGASSGGQQSSSSSSTAGSLQSGGSSVASAEDFWGSLATELKTRLTVLMPRPSSVSQQSTGMGLPNDMPAPQPISLGMPGGSPGGMRSPLPPGGVSAMGLNPGMGMNPAIDLSASAGMYISRQIGTYSLNPETGAITVQAPHWILNDLDAYLKRVQEMYNTDITFSGELVLVTSNRADSEGFDLAAFSTWAGGTYTVAIANNALGGITLSKPDGNGVGSISTAAGQLAGPVVGLQIQHAWDAINIFNSYLASIGKVSVIQKPLITTTSGVPGVFSKKFTDYYNTLSQQAATGGTGAAATATQNTLVPVELGMELRINPRIDISTGLIRAQLSLNQAIQSGVKSIAQTITAGNQATSVTTQIPLITRQSLSGEVLLRDGDLIVVGGQTENDLTSDESGLPGQDGPLGGFLGVKKASRGAQTHYFALRVSVSKRK